MIYVMKVLVHKDGAARKTERQFEAVLYECVVFGREAMSFCLSPKGDVLIPCLWPQAMSFLAFAVKRRL